MTVVCSRPLRWASLAALPPGRYFAVTTSVRIPRGVGFGSGMRGVVCWILWILPKFCGVFLVLCLCKRTALGVDNWG